jgi:sulfite reductase (NADPH) flavoprotein alpha-component
VRPSDGFRIAPADHAMIMIGPGTGIAPFRAFLQERRATGAIGRNWLFFGNPRRDTDFLFEDELTSYCRDGLLARLDTAFSRDQEHKIYVQHRMLEHAATLWAWLEEGAHLYVCGDAARMARDVDRGLAYSSARKDGWTLRLPNPTSRTSPPRAATKKTCTNGEYRCSSRPSTSSPRPPSSRRSFCGARRSGSRSAR